MAKFIEAFEKMIRNEGGYVNHTVTGDRGGQTYAGIARVFHRDWKGWQLIDANEAKSEQLTRLVMEFYQEKFWDKLRASEISNQKIAESIFDFAVNAGLRTAVKLAQKVIGTTADGIIGINTLTKLNQAEEALFISQYALAKIERYAQIVKRDRSQSKFLLGWVNRTTSSLYS